MDYSILDVQAILDPMWGDTVPDGWREDPLAYIADRVGPLDSEAWPTASDMADAVIEAARELAEFFARVGECDDCCRFADRTELNDGHHVCPDCEQDYEQCPRCNRWVTDACLKETKGEAIYPPAKRRECADCTGGRE